MLPLLRMKEFGRDSSEFSGLGRSPLGLALKKSQSSSRLNGKDSGLEKRHPR